MTTFVDFKKVKEAVSILQLLDRYDVTKMLKRSGDSLRGPCPIHEGGNPTAFRVSVSKSCWNCFGACQGGGNILDFVARMERVEIRDAALLIQEWFALDTSPQAPKPEPTPARPTPQRQEEREEPTRNKPLGFSLTVDPTHPYLAERGLSEEAIKTFGLGYADKGIMAGRIAIPIHDSQGQLVAYAGRWPGTPPQEGKGKYKLPPKFSKALEVYNLHRAIAENVSSGPLVVVEGFFDTIKLWQLGHRRTVALMGSSLSDAQVRQLLVAVDRSRRIALLLDEDEAGRKGSEKALAKLAPHAFVRVITFPKEGLQPEHLDAEQLHEILS